MIKTPLHIEIVSSTIIGLSSMSRRSRDEVATVLRRQYSQVGITLIDCVSDLERLVMRRPDVVLLGMKYIPMNSYSHGHLDRIWISEYLDRCGIAYTGSDYIAHRLELNKPLAKRRIRSSGLRTAPFFVVRKNKPFRNQDVALQFPLFVKPTDRGGGLGIDSSSLVHTYKELRAKVASIAVDLHADSLIEEYLPGREFSVAVLADTYTDAHFVMPIELRAAVSQSGESILSKTAKAFNTEIVSLVSDHRLKERVCTLAADVFHALGARDYGRIDIRLDQTGEPQFLEANLIPSLIDGYGSFPKACRLNMSMDYETMLSHIIQLALSRKDSIQHPYMPAMLPTSPDVALTHLL